MKIALRAENYRDPFGYEQERRNVWSREWVMFCTTAELSKPGDYYAADLAGWNLLLTVNPQGEIIGFHNVCPHRAGVIAWPGNGTLGNLVCRYHGWAFAWDGSLKSARDFGNDEPLCAEDFELKKVSVQAWGPFVFVCLDPNAAPLLESLGGLPERISQYPIETFTYAQRIQREISCNWKTYVDNYLEGYHVPLLHPSLTKALDMSTYQVSIPEPSFCLHTCDTTQGSASGGAWLFRYPNLALNIYADGMNVERIIPLSYDRTMIIYDYFSVDTSAESIARMVDLSNVVLDEDQLICEAVQRNLNSGVYEAGPLSPRHEIGLMWFQRKIAEAISL